MLQTLQQLREIAAEARLGAVVASVRQAHAPSAIDDHQVRKPAQTKCAHCFAIGIKCHRQGNLATLRKCAHPLERITAAIGGNEDEFDIAASLKIGTNTLQFRQLCNTWRTPGGKKSSTRILPGLERIGTGPWLIGCKVNGGAAPLPTCVNARCICTGM
jgi:hypothetical protein